MARQDQMEALYEFFGGTPNTYVTQNPSVFPNIKTLVKGEPLKRDKNEMPMIFMSAPKTKEERYSAQLKFIIYTLTPVVVWWTSSDPSKGERGSYAMDQFYGFLDSVAAKIRTNKQLITTSYPQGASIKFGENFTIQETHERLETDMLFVAKFDIESIEQVFA